MLAPFNFLEGGEVQELIADFYQNRFARYFDYDFSIMSKHALSRIYEHYVSLLRFTDSSQTSFLPTLPEEQIERSYGNIYTPEFIAKFFAKYLRKEVPLSKFQRMRIGDPACGSGIFLRTMLETKCETLLPSMTTNEMLESFSSVFGVDIDPNACAAARLSLSLLSLVLTGSVPQSLNIFNADILDFYLRDTGSLQPLDAVVTNPPFVTTEDLPADRRELLLRTLGENARGKADLYLGILNGALDNLKEDGFGMFVLPKNFLISENAAGVRKTLLRTSVLHCVIDLSAIKIFEQVGAYVVLLIFQKQANRSKRPVLVVRCNDLVGLALEDALNGREVKTPAYHVYWSSQPAEGPQEWDLSPPERVALYERTAVLPKLGDVADLRQGVITGADDVFVIPASSVPKGERRVYIPFLADREMTPYSISKRPKSYLFYPFHGDRPLEQEELEKDYPETWDYLVRHQAKLKARKAVRASGNNWWRPVRPREPRSLLRPKIVSPHLVISPRFAVDLKGEFAVSHSPYLFPKEPGGTDELLYLLGVLNSTPCFWFITQGAHTYSRGYSRLEVATLKKVPFPDPGRIDRGLFREIVRLVSLRFDATGKDGLDLEQSLDDRVADAYELNERDRSLVGLGAFNEM